MMGLLVTLLSRALDCIFLWQRWSGSILMILQALSIVYRFFPFILCYS
jgi:hypothetical protein